ncbi:MAG: TonB-dependent receptor domain-containing protein [Acidobacteriota bacterium]
MGTLTGTVVDSTGAVVPGAAIVATNVETGVEVKSTTTSAGAYTFPYLQSGTYKIYVTAPGFRPAQQDNVILRVAQTQSINITLEVGAVTEQVTVTSQAEALETGSAEIGRYITTEEFKTWPIFVSDGQRQIQSFIFSSLPGTTGSTFQGSINGGQMYSHEILIEGIPVGRADLAGGNADEFSPSAEGVGEFKLQSGAIGAQYNGGQTAVANFSIKSGTNDLHGSGFFYLQNEALNAWDLGSKSTMTAGQKKAKHRQDNEGFSIGGPVYIPKIYNGKNKTFFFFDFEKTHENNLTFGNFSTLATTDFKKGDFSRLLDPNYTGNAMSGKQIGTDALGRPIIFGQIYDPRTTRTVDGQVVRDPFVGNIIPESAFDPVAKNILAIGLVDPTRDTMLNNISRISTSSPFFDLHTFGIKADHNISDKHHFSAYYNQSYRNRLNNSGGANGRYMPVPGPVTTTWKNQYTPGRMVRASLNSTLTNNIVNRVAAGFNRFFNSNGARPDTINAGWAEKLGIQNTSDAFFPTFAFSGNSWQGGTIAQIGAGGLYPGANGSWVLNDDLTWIHGRHSVHFGYQYARYYYNERNPDGSGAFYFHPTQTDLNGYANETGNAFASFLLGATQRASRGINPLSSGFRQPQHAFYAMDDIKITPKLTVNAGLRWEIIPPFFERTGRMSYIDLDAPNPEAGNLPGALVFAKTPSTTYWREFGPRLGFAYQMSNKMVIRGGYAMTNTPPIANSWGYGGFTYGYNAAVNVRAGTSPTGFVDDPAMYLSQPFPSFNGTLPVTDPSSGNWDAYQTTAPDANRPGYTQNWNFTIQYQLPGETVIEAAYVGNKGTRLWGGQGQNGEMNALPASLLTMGDTLIDHASDHPEFIPYADFPASDFSVAQAMRRFPQYGSIQEAFPYNSNANFNSLQITATRHLTKGLGFLAAYTWSKTMSYVDAMGAAQYYVSFQDYYNRKLEHSTAFFNYPSNLKLTWVYETPFGKGRKWDLGLLNFALGGWQASAIHNYHSGDPVQVYSSGLWTPDGFSGYIRPDIISGVPLTLSSLPSHVDYFNPTPYLNPAAFENVPMTGNGVPLRVGTAPRYINGLRGPRYISEQFRLAKKFYIKERANVGLGMTMTNPFNRTGRYIANTTVGDADFGILRANGGGRIMQLDLRVEF